jgi:hypothetical protein
MFSSRVPVRTTAATLTIHPDLLVLEALWQCGQLGHSSKAAQFLFDGRSVRDS